MARSNSPSQQLERREFLAVGAAGLASAAVAASTPSRLAGSAVGLIAPSAPVPPPLPFPLPPLPQHFWTVDGDFYGTSKEARKAAKQHDEEVHQHDFQPLPTERRFTTVWVKWGVEWTSLPKREGETSNEQWEREAVVYRAAKDAYPLPGSYVDLPVCASSYESFVYHPRKPNMMTRDEAIEEVAATNEDFDFDGGAMELWLVAVEMGVEPDSCNVTSELAAATVGKLSVTIDHPIRIVHPTEAERLRYAIEWEADGDASEGEAA